MECESKSDTSHNTGDWNHFKISQSISEQHTSKTRNYGTGGEKKAILGTAHTLRKVLM